MCYHMHMNEAIEIWRINREYEKICKQAVVEKWSFPFTDSFYGLFKFRFGDESVGKRIKEEDTVGNCYFYSLLLARAMPKSQLMHGFLHKLDIDGEKRKIVFAHAWVERGNMVFDTTARQVFNKDDYYRTFDVKVYRKYPFEDLKGRYKFFKLATQAVNNRPMLASEVAQHKAFENIRDDYKKQCIKKIDDIETKRILENNLFVEREKGG